MKKKRRKPPNRCYDSNGKHIKLLYIEREDSDKFTYFNDEWNKNK